MYDLPLHLWYSITRLGGAGLTLPLALTIALWLALGYTWRLALAWLGLLAGAVGIVALTKIAFLGWGVGVRAWDFTGVSGHAMLSTAVYPVGIFLILLPARARVRIAGIAIGLAAGVAVGLSRVVLDAHAGKPASRRHAARPQPSCRATPRSGPAWPESRFASGVIGPLHLPLREERTPTTVHGRTVITSVILR